MADSLDWTGRIRYIDIGFFDETNVETYAKEQILLESAISPLCGLRNSNSDKRTYGHLFILAGSRSMPGALLMSVRAALKSGVGLVTAFAPESTAAQLAASCSRGDVDSMARDPRWKPFRSKVIPNAKACRKSFCFSHWPRRGTRDPSSPTSCSQEIIPSSSSRCRRLDLRWSVQFKDQQS